MDKGLKSKAEESLQALIIADDYDRDCHEVSPREKSLLKVANICLLQYQVKHLLK